MDRLRALVCFASFLAASPLPAQQTTVLQIPVVGRLPIPTQMHGTAVIGSRLYLFGGENTDGWSNLTFSAPIASDGKLGSWRSEAALPVRLAYLNNCVEVVGNRIYIMGGVILKEAKSPESNLPRNSDVYWTDAGVDGVLGTWHRGARLPVSELAFMATCSSEHHLLVTGGANKTTVFQPIFRTELGPDGEPVGWKEIGKLPKSLWHHGAAILEDRLYVWGGLDSRLNSNQMRAEPASSNAQTWSAELRRDGTLGSWTDEEKMPRPTFGAANAGFNDYLISIGGRYQDKMPLNSIWYTRLTKGKCGPWRMENTDLEARVYHSLGLDRTHGWIFVTGGQKKTAVGQTDQVWVDVVQAFQIPQPAEEQLQTAVVAAASASTQAGPSGFQDLGEAMRRAKETPQPVLVFFYSPQVPACRRFWDSVLSTPQFQSLSRGLILAAHNVSDDPRGIAPHYGVYKVPALALLNADGSRRGIALSPAGLEDVTKLIGPDKNR